VTCPHCGSEDVAVFMPECLDIDGQVLVSGTACRACGVHRINLRPAASTSGQLRRIVRAWDQDGQGRLF
jgi:C4-type Zn-finger protein